ncbi:MAG: hypothetical protein AAFX81_13205 [Pseudomonadota bacterium]
MEESYAGLVALAEGYPYDLREEAFTFRGGEAQPFDTDLLLDRTAFLAIGSNAAPQRLLAKFGHDEIVPVIPARLADHAVVYAATVTGYGSIPATIVVAPGAVALVSVTFLTDGQVATMDESEAVGERYERIDLTEATQIETGPFVGPVVAYRSLLGALLVNDQPLRLAEVPTVGTKFGAAYQTGVLALLHLTFAQPGEAYASFVGALVGSPGRREEIASALRLGLRTPGHAPCRAQKPESVSAT